MKKDQQQSATRDPHRWWSLVSSLCLVGIVGVLDYATGFEISFSIFYLIPILIISWNVGKRAGFGFAVLGAVVWLIVDVQSQAYTHPLIPYWNAFVRFCFFSTVVLLVCQRRESYESVEEVMREVISRSPHHSKSAAQQPQDSQVGRAERAQQ